LSSGAAIVTTQSGKPLAPSTRRSQNSPTSAELAEIERSLTGLRYGSVLVVVQDGVIVQIDRTEKHRLRLPNARSSLRDAAE
jgi:hypothetical protein